MLYSSLQGLNKTVQLLYMWSLLCCTRNDSFFDSLWVVIHFASGILVGLIILFIFDKQHRPLNDRSYSHRGLSLIMAWEYFELALRFMFHYDIWPIHSIIKILPSDFAAIESPINIISDLLMGIAGLYLAHWMWRKYRHQK